MMEMNLPLGYVPLNFRIYVDFRIYSPPTEQKSTSTLTPALLLLVGEQCRPELTRWRGAGDGAALALLHKHL